MDGKKRIASLRDEMKKKGLITINKTAGLNTVYPERKLSLKEVFQMKFGGEQHV